jgi:hypothetical protein
MIWSVSGIYRTIYRIPSLKIFLMCNYNDKISRFSSSLDSFWYEVLIIFKRTQSWDRNVSYWLVRMLQIFKGKLLIITKFEELKSLIRILLVDKNICNVTPPFCCKNFCSGEAFEHYRYAKIQIRTLIGRIMSHNSYLV